MFLSKALKRLKLISLTVIASCLPIAVTAQITPDGTTSTEVTTEGNETTIEQGDRAGDNLFHSFDEFSVPTGGTAGFNNAADIANIFSRVTGSNISDIDGLLRANGAANLFLINPNGIIFGENASLDIGGSFFASTTDSLQFEGEAEFSASDPQAAPLLEVSIPVGLSFRDNPGDIAVNGSALEVPNGENLSLIGGNVDMTGVIDNFILAIEGRVQLSGLTEAGTIEINTDETAALASSSLNFPEAVAKGDVSLSNGTIVSVAGRDGGSIGIDARNITLSNGEIGASQLDAGIVEPGVENAEGGDVILNATGNVDILNGSSILNQVLQGTSGDGGNIEINANSLNVTGDFDLGSSTVSTALSGTGNTGKVILNVSDRTSLTSFANVSSNLTEFGVGDTGGVEINSGSLEIRDRSFIGSQNGGRGNAGDVVIDTGEFTISDRNEINTEVFDIGIGDGADINIFADDITFSINDSIIADTAGQGNAGNVEINASNSVLMESGAEIRSDTLETATGNGGNITVDTPNLNMGSGNFISTTTEGIGDAGNIEINSNKIDLSVNASIATQTFENSQGRAGRIDIKTTNLSLERDAEGTEQSSTAISSNTSGSGDANDINIQASESISLSGQSSIQTTVAAERGTFDVRDGVFVPRPIVGSGNGGDITISTGSLTLEGGAQIFSSTEGFGDAGSVRIDATDSILVTGTGRGINDSFVSLIASDVFDPLAVGNAGTLEINTSTLTVSDGAGISAITLGEGNASDITIDASETVSIEEGAFVASEAQVDSIGNGGNVRINTQDLDITDEGQINTSNFGQGNGGDVFVVADAVALNNGSISAENTPVEQAEGRLTGGEVNLEVADIVTLDNNSLVTAEAGSNADGGNVDIDTDIVVAFSGNNDIVANAEQGNGGRIDIDTQAIFGLEERASTPPNRTNDIDASSEFGLQGDFSLNTPDFDPTSGLLELPTSVGDASDQISQNPCQQGVGSEFIVTGKGGLPRNPADSLGSNEVQVGLVEPLLGQGDITRENKQSSENKTSEAVPAMGWVFNDKGEVTLTAYSNTDMEKERLASPERGARSHLTPNTCNSKASLQSGE